MTHEISVQEDCALNYANEVIFPKWNNNIVLELISSPNGELSFSEIAQRIPEISPRMLSMRLKHLVDYKVLDIIPNENKPKKVRYELTKNGNELAHVLNVIRNWSLKYGNCQNQLCQDNLCAHGIAINKMLELFTL